MKIPSIIYGTAWKEEKTQALVKEAIRLGFVGIDTANQRKHYFEEAVGKAIEGVRERLFLQTKFTYVRGQDHRLPYDPHADPATQVRQSFESSLRHLGTDHIDSYLLHGPETAEGLTETDWEVWEEMEALQREGKVTYLGISNVDAQQLRLLCKKARPRFVQNRCYAQLGWDREVREVCKENDVIYQGFSLLTANFFVLPTVARMAQAYGKTSAQIVLRFAQKIGILPLTGTTNHMQDDLDLDFELEKEEIAKIERTYQAQVFSP